MYYLAFYSGLVAMLNTHEVQYRELGNYFQMWIQMPNLVDTFSNEEHACFCDCINMTWDAAQAEMDKHNV